MNKLSFIIGLKRSYEDFKKEQEAALESYNAEYYFYLRALGFDTFIEHVLIACAMYPRSQQSCQDNLTDLSYGIYSNLGITQYRLTHENQNSLCNLVLRVGREIISQLDSHRYYLSDRQIPRGSELDPDYATDLTANCDVDRIGTYSFQVLVTESDFDEMPKPRMRRMTQSEIYNRSLH